MTDKKTLLLLCLILIIYILVSYKMVFAGILRGRVLCQDNHPYANGVIKVVRHGREVIPPIKTGEYGSFVLILPEGEYELRMGSQAFKILMREENVPLDFYISCPTH